MGARWLVGAVCVGLSLGPIGACKRVVRGCVRSESIKPMPAATDAKDATDTTVAANGSDPVGGSVTAPNPPDLLPLPALARLSEKHPRIALTQGRRARMKRLAAQHAPSWTRVAHSCEEASATRIASGYEAWDWTNAALSCAMVYHVGGDESAARTAVTYLRALVDDKSKVGDGLGGDSVIRHDNGYSIRTRGFLGAIAYDWLHDAPGVTPELRKHVVDRMSSWLEWYGREGYMRDHPIANYYAGYFGTLAMIGIAADGDDPRATKFRAQAQRMFLRDVIPAFARLDGGQWPEGWQYGGGPAVTMALYTATERVRLPWLEQVVAYRTHALEPDGIHLYDNGDWSEKPAVASAAELDAVAFAFDQGAGDAASADTSTPSLAKQARALTAKAVRKRDDPFGWLTALTDDPAASLKPEDDPRRGAKSYLAAGTGTVFARTDWSPGAVWLAFQSGPYLSDHQHLDQGHFEIVRGADALVVDPGAYGSGSSMSHNTILVDDAKETLVYSPNQVPVSRATISRFSDDGTYAHALGDFTSAYEPPHFKEDGKRSVLHAEREILFSRTQVASSSASARLVIYDRIAVTKPEYAVTWIAHTGGTAELTPPPSAGEPGVREARFTVGDSTARISTVAPAQAKSQLVHVSDSEKGDGYWTNVAPAKGLRATRLEVPSPTGGVERRFLHVIAVSSAAAPRMPVVAVRGDAVEGAALDGEAYIFLHTAVQSSPTGFDYTAPEDAHRHIVAGLAPSAGYVVSTARAEGGCKVTLTPGNTGTRTTDSGILVLSIAGCAPK